MTWQNGRQLASINSTDLSASYSYGMDGIRTAKTVNGITTEYYWQNGILQGQRTGNDSILFLYNASGAAYGMICKTGETESTYYYLFNTQGDVIALLDSAGNCVAEYAYDEWGKLLTITGSQADTTGLLNPIRYRGYYYDSETGFYYLQSRYYDPEIGRFINADNMIAYLSANNTTIDTYNLFAYCGNNPIVRTDPSGHFWLTATAIIATGAIVGGLLGAFNAAATGGNILESAIEGSLTGAVGSACGLLISNPITAIGLAIVSGSTIDFATQVTSQYIENKSVDFSKIEYERVLKTGIQTGIGTAIPKLGAGANNVADAFGTALIWAEGSTLITCADIIVTNTASTMKPPFIKKQPKKYGLVYQHQYIWEKWERNYA